MSTFENKVTAVYDFLANRASLKRLTNHQEVGVVAGQLLYARGQRSISSPVRREKIVDVLRAVDDRSLNKHGVMLSAYVVHFWDNAAGHRFFESAESRDLWDGDDPEAFHKGQLRKAHRQAFPEFVPVSTSGRVPDDISELDDIDDEADAPW